MIYLAFDRFFGETPMAGSWGPSTQWGPTGVIAYLLRHYPERFALAHVSKLLEAHVRFAYVLQWRYYYGYGTALNGEDHRKKVKQAFGWLVNHPILPGLRAGKIKLVLIDWCEGDVDPVTDVLPGNDYKFQVLAELLQVPIKSIVFVHADARAQTRNTDASPHYIFEDVFEESTLHDSRDRVIQQGPIGDHPLDKPLRFLSYSRHWNEYRQYLTLELFSRGLNEHGLISCGTGMHATAVENERALVDGLDTWAANERELEHLRQQAPGFNASLPLTLDHDLSINLVHHVTYEHYVQTDLSLINETWVNDRTVFVSEKVFKTMSLKHPFLLFGNPGTLAHLRDLGYRTFAPYLDESYDVERHLPTRKNMLLQVLEDFCQLSTNKRHRLRQHLDEVAAYNYEHLQKTVDRNTFGKNLLSYLSNIFEREHLGAV